jgi:hypothetical protein
MPADATPIAGRNTAAPSPKAGGKVRLLTLGDLDRRTAAYQKTRRLIDDIESDLNADSLSTGERQLVQRAAVLGALLEDTESRWIEGEPIDATAYCTIVNAQRRVLETIGLGSRRYAKDITPLNRIDRETRRRRERMWAEALNGD